MSSRKHAGLNVSPYLDQPLKSVFLKWHKTAFPERGARRFLLASGVESESVRRHRPSFTGFLCDARLAQGPQKTTASLGLFGILEAAAVGHSR